MSPAKPWPKVAEPSFGNISLTKPLSRTASKSTCAFAALSLAANAASANRDRASAAPATGAAAGEADGAVCASVSEKSSVCAAPAPASALSRCVAAAARAGSAALTHFEHDVRGRIDGHGTAQRR